MKKVFKNTAEVCHVWAQQNQEEGRSGNVFFDGPSIYSYGRHFKIAQFVKTDKNKDAVLFTTRGYSVSTEKHKSYTHRALGNVRMFHVPNVDTSATSHRENVDYFLSEIARQLDEFTRRKTNIAFHTGQIRNAIANAKDYADEFYTALDQQRINLVEDYWSKSDEYPTALEIEKAQKREANYNVSQMEKLKRKRVAYEAKHKEEIAKYKEDLEKWKNGELEQTPYAFGYDSTTYLRIHGDEVQTSKGASVPLSFCKRFWQRFKADPETVKGLPMGHYKIDDVRDDNVIAGCHVIPRSEIERMAVVLNW